MSEDKLYMETGELPPQGIGPEKVRRVDEQTTKEEIVEFIRDHTDLEYVRDVHFENSDVVITLTDEMNSYDKGMSESIGWRGHWMCSALETALHTWDLHERAQVNLRLIIPKETFVENMKPPAMDEQKGVKDED